MPEKISRNCYNCQHYRLCGCRQDIDKAIRKVKINIDSKASPKSLEDIFEAMGGACLDFTQENL